MTTERILIPHLGKHMLPTEGSEEPILPSNTGHLDLIQEGNCYPLIQQNPVNRIHNLGQILTGWGESSVMGIADQLERIYCERKVANAIGLRGAEIATQMSWKSTTGALKRVVIG